MAVSPDLLDKSHVGLTTLHFPPTPCKQTNVQSFIDRGAADSAHIPWPFLMVLHHQAANH